jgi:hypothetical protein
MHEFRVLILGCSRRPDSHYLATLHHSDALLPRHDFSNHAHVQASSVELGRGGRLGSPHVSSRSRNWGKVKNLNAPAPKREAEEDWN